MAKVAEESCAAVQRKWIGKIITQLFMIRDSNDQIERCWNFVQKDQSKFKDKMLVDSFGPMQLILDPGATKDEQVLKDTCTFCKSPAFLFFEGFVWGATGKVLHGRMESTRIRLTEFTGVARELANKVPPEFSVDAMRLEKQEEWLGIKTAMVHATAATSPEFIEKQESYQKLAHKLSEAKINLSKAVADHFDTDTTELAKDVNQAFDICSNPPEDIKNSKTWPSVEEVGFTSLCFDTSNDPAALEYVRLVKQSCDLRKCTWKVVSQETHDFPCTMSLNSS